MKILLPGSDGMLGQALAKQLRRSGYEVSGIDRNNAEFCFDLLDDDSLRSCIYKVMPDIIINAAAIVNLEFCEAHPGEAYNINGRLPGIAADICKREGIYFVHISTDHFYCGDDDKKHTEEDPVTLVNEYARTKFTGECLAFTNPDTLVLRTNIVGFREGGQQTFAEWAVSEADRGRCMRLFSDFYTSPVHTADFAVILCDLLKKHATGLLNLASHDTVSKKEFILGLSNAVFHREPPYIDQSVKELKGAPRADSLGLDTGRIESMLGYEMPSFQNTILSLANEYKERRAEHALSYIHTDQ